MFRKMLSDGKIRHFRNAPPTTALDDINEDRLPGPPYAGVPPEKRSVYYYWWAFLRENREYMGCCANLGKGSMAELYHDFGDVRGDDFFAWWIKCGRELFCERGGLAIKLHNELPHDHDFENELLVSIPMASNTQRALEELEITMQRIVKMQRNPKLASSANAPPSTARRPVHTKPVIKTLDETLRLWQLSQQYEQQGKKVPQYLLADEIGLEISKDHPENDPDTKNLKASVVSRMLKEARNLIHNVGEGRFPDKKGPSEELSARRLKMKADEERRNNRSLGQPMVPKPADRGRYK